VSYDVDDVEAALARVTEDAAFARDFFERYVRGRDAPDFPALLAAVGLEVGLAREGAAWLGPLAMRFDDGGAILLGTPLIDSPLYDAGVDRGDRILSIDGVAISTPAQLTGVLASTAPGDPVQIRYESRGETLTVTVPMAADPTLTGRWLADGTMSATQASLRVGWKVATSR